MWGGVILETLFTGNYTFGFLTNRSNNLLHLTHWQYWFWFWFSWYLGLYYIIFFNFFFKRNIFSSPKIATSFRSHGKWGDFIVCAVPLSWCLNILINSNFLLRLVEWQSASTYFSIRVRGKQWYWLYLIDSNFLLHEKQQQQWGWSGWAHFNTSKNLVQSELLRLVAKESNTLLWTKGLGSKTLIGSPISNVTLPQTLQPFALDLLKVNHNLNTNTLNSTTISSSYIGSSSFTTHINTNTIQTIQKSDQLGYTPINTLPSIYVSGSNDIYDFNYQAPQTQFLKKESFEFPTAVFKQKRFSYSGGSVKSQNNLITLGYHSKNLQSDYLAGKNASLFNKRMLRTDKVLLLPTNVNISVLTNSFDVIHSWFIPGLGLKLDCVPGRSTQHTLHIVTPGFYYGQCAEICGRYHHHMPIRICAVSVPHFLFWWTNKGVNGLLKTHFKEIN